VARTCSMGGHINHDEAVITLVASAVNYRNDRGTNMH